MNLDSLRVFEINSSVFWAGRGSPDAILRVYLQSSPDVATCDQGIMPRVLCEAELDSLLLQNSNENGQLAEPQTFREYLQELVRQKTFFPCFFAALQVPMGAQDD